MLFHLNVSDFESHNALQLLLQQIALVDHGVVRAGRRIGLVQHCQRALAHELAVLPDLALLCLVACVEAGELSLRCV